MDPYQNQGLFPNTPAPGAADLSSVQGTALANAPNQFTDVQYKAPPGVIAVPFGQEHPGRAYTRWAGQAVEINDNLYSEHICPSDLNGVPCEHDEPRLGEPCTLLRLCQNLEKYNGWVCPNRTGGSCPHIHDIVMSCRFIAKQHRPPHKICKLVEEKGLGCSYGHDLPKARQDAYDHYHVHLLQAKARGSKGVVKFKKRW